MRSNLKKERIERKLTQKALAQKLNVSEVYVRKLEAGTSDPGVQTAVMYAEYFEQPLEYLFPDIFLLSFDTKRI